MHASQIQGCVMEQRESWEEEEDGRVRVGS